MDTKASGMRIMAACAALALLALALALPARSLADSGLAAGAERPKYHQLEGTVYFSRSHDSKFCISDGETPGVPMANAPIDLAEVCKVDLDDYGLGAYKLAAPEGAPYEYECTLMQLFVYAAKAYAANGAEDMQVTGESHHSYIKKYWGEGENFLYYLNGAFPMDSSLGEGQGATSDVIPLKDGDVLTVAYYTYWNFYEDDDAGFHFFVDAAGDLAHTYLARAGEPVDVRLVRASEGSGSGTNLAPEAGWRLWWGAAYDDSTANLHAAGSTATGGDGSAQVTFDEPGTYYVWADGGKGAKTDRIVSSPACARVVVSDAAGPAPAMVARPRAAAGLVYDGTEQVGVVAGGAAGTSGGDPSGAGGGSEGGGAAQVEHVVLSGTVSATDAGSYTAYAVPAEGSTWPDGTEQVVEIPWSISPASLAGAEVSVSPGEGGLAVTAALDGHELAPGDFSASVSAEFDSGSGTASVTATVRGRGNYAGTASCDLAVASDALSMRLSPARAEFTGSRITPQVAVVANGAALAPSDYELRYVNGATGASSRVAPTAAGEYTVVARLGADASARLGYDSASVFAPFEIYERAQGSDDPSGQGQGGGPAAKKANPMKVAASPVAVKAKKLKKKARTVAAVDVTGAEGRVTFKITKIATKKKLAKQAKKKIKMASGGKLKLKKKLKKGAYKVTISVTAAGNESFEPATKDVTVKVKVN